MNANDIDSDSMQADEFRGPEIEWLLIADAAQAVGGKIYVLGGGWDVVHRPRLPDDTQAPALSVAVALSLKVPWVQTNRKHFVVVEIRDIDGQEIAPSITAEIEVGRPAGIKQGRQQRATMAVTANLHIPEPGEYVVSAHIQGVEASERRVVFDVVDLPVGLHRAA